MGDYFMVGVGLVVAALFPHYAGPVIAPYPAAKFAFRVFIVIHVTVLDSLKRLKLLQVCPGKAMR